VTVSVAAAPFGRRGALLGVGRLPLAGYSGAVRAVVSGLCPVRLLAGDRRCGSGSSRRCWLRLRP